MIFEDNQIVSERVDIKLNKYKFFENILKHLFDSKTMPYIVVLFLLTSVKFIGVQPMAIAMLGVATIFGIPLLFPLVVSLISFFIFKSDISIIVNYVITYFTYAFFVSIFDIEGFSKKYVTMLKLVIATAISSTITMLIFDVSSSGITTALIMTLSVSIFYPVITSGMYLFFNIKKKIIFSKEETVSFVVILTLALIPFHSIIIANFSVVDVIATVIVILVAWKNDCTLGATLGVIVGLIIAICTSENSLIISSLALSGLIAGVLNRFNKYVVITAFVAGNFVLSYLYLRDIEVWAKLAQVLVASGIILVLPRKMIIKLEDIMGKSGMLGRGYENQLGAASDIKDKLNAMAEVFDNLSHISMVSTNETKKETAEVIQKYLEDYKKNECIGCKNKLNCLSEEIGLVSSHIAERLENNKNITKEMLPVDCSLSEEIIDNIKDIYNNIKLMRIIKEKENEANTKMAEEYKAVSNIIKNMSQESNDIAKSVTPEQKNIREELKFIGYVVYEDILEKNDNYISYEFITDILIDIDRAKSQIQKVVSEILKTNMTIKLVLNSSKNEKSRIKLIPTSKYIVNAVVRQIRKADSAVSGDSYIVTELKDNSKLIAISDGMGSGAKSKEISESVINMIEKMNASGFDRNLILDIINKVIKIKDSSNISATMDLCIIDEKHDHIEFVKLGAACSYIIKDNEVKIINQDNMPIGLLSNLQYKSEVIDIAGGMYIVMMSDGATSDINEKTIKDIIAGESTLNEKIMADKLMEKLVGGQNKIILDDITLIVCKIV